MIYANILEHHIGCDICLETVELSRRVSEDPEAVLILVQDLRLDHGDCEAHKHDRRGAIAARAYKIAMRRAASPSGGTKARAVSMTPADLQDLRFAVNTGNAFDFLMACGVLASFLKHWKHLAHRRIVVLAAAFFGLYGVVSVVAVIDLARGGVALTLFCRLATSLLGATAVATLLFGRREVLGTFLSAAHEHSHMQALLAFLEERRKQRILEFRDERVLRELVETHQRQVSHAQQF